MTYENFITVTNNHWHKRRTVPWHFHYYKLFLNIHVFHQLYLQFCFLKFVVNKGLVNQPSGPLPCLAEEKKLYIPESNKVVYVRTEHLLDFQADVQSAQASASGT
jgi:hypothetical protein